MITVWPNLKNMEKKLWTKSKKKNSYSLNGIKSMVLIKKEFKEKLQLFAGNDLKNVL